MLVILTIKPLPSLVSKAIIPAVKNLALDRIQYNKKVKKMNKEPTNEKVQVMNLIVATNESRMSMSETSTSADNKNGIEKSAIKKKSLKVKEIKLTNKKNEAKPQTIDRTQSLSDIQIKKMNEKLVYLHIGVEHTKPTSNENIAEEYTQKVILFGYIMLFGSSFWLAPLILLLICVFDLRIDALSSLWLYRRPTGYKAQDIGAWFSICRFLTAIGIVSNAFIIAFTSQWSKTRLQNNLSNKLLLVIVFEVDFLIYYFY